MIAILTDWTEDYLKRGSYKVWIPEDLDHSDLFTLGVFSVFFLKGEISVHKIHTSGSRNFNVGELC